MKIFMTLFITSLTLSSCKSWVNRASDGDEIDSDYDDVEQALNAEKNEKGFCFNGMLRLTFAYEALQNRGGNAVCSPVTALLPLGKLMLGASNKGLQELIGIIGVEHDSNEDGDEIQAPEVFRQLIRDLQSLPGAKLDLASRIYVSESSKLKKKFLYNTWEVFRSSIEKVSFEKPSHLVDEINGWVSRQTHGAIPLMLTPEQISPAASMVIVNGIYFRGNWKIPFDKLEVGDFFSPSGQKKVQLMSRQDFFRHGKCSGLNAQIIEIPYKGMKSSFIVILPNDKDGLPLLLNTLKLAPTLLNKALRAMKKQLVIVTIPKFKIQSSIDLKDVFDKIGMKQILSNSSGLTEIAKKEELQITTAVQEAVIDVQEEIITIRSEDAESVSGTETPDLDQVVFLANHPFLFFVKANREQLMAGILSEP